MGFPNAEALVIGMLRPRLAAPVYQTPPPDPPSAYVRVHRVGGIPRDLVTDRPLLSISCYAADPGAAADLANRTREVFAGFPGHWMTGTRSWPRSFCRGWREASGPAHYPDPDRPDRTRYQFSGELDLSTNR